MNRFMCSCLFINMTVLGIMLWDKLALLFSMGRSGEQKIEMLEDGGLDAYFDYEDKCVIVHDSARREVKMSINFVTPEDCFSSIANFPIDKAIFSADLFRLSDLK